MIIIFQIAWYLAVAATVVYVLMQFFLYLGCRKVAAQPKRSEAIRPFTVIIAARNEYENLKRFLPSVLNQKYEVFEVIVVLDRCTDRSEEVLREFQINYPFLRFIRVDELAEGWAGKKYALQRGIEGAKYEYLAFTDADCEVGEMWLVEMNGHFGEETSLVLGVGPYFEEDTFLNRWIRFETYYTAFQYVGFAAWGLPYMGVGRNIGYRKSFFLKHKGFETFKARLSGDDDLLVNAFAEFNATKMMISMESSTFSPPKKSWKTWLRQKFRHVSASTAYSPLSKFLLTVFHFAHIGMYFFLFAAILGGNTTLCQGFWLYLSGVLLKWVIFVKSSRHIKAPHLYYLFPLWDIMMVVYIAIVVPLGIIRKPTWT